MSANVVTDSTNRKVAFLRSLIRVDGLIFTLEHDDYLLATVTQYRVFEINRMVKA